MTSSVEICNRALAKIGVTSITSLDQGTRISDWCKVLYNPTRLKICMLGAWSSVTRRAALNALSTSPAYEYTYQYQLPTSPKCLAVLYINEDVAGFTPFTVEGDKILSDASTMKIQYVADIEDVSMYSPLLQEAIVTALAGELAAAIKSDFKAAESLKRESIEIAQHGLAVEGAQGSSLINKDTDANIARDDY